MSLFSSKPKNRRRRRRKPSAEKCWEALPAKSGKSKKSSQPRDLVGQVYELNAQIGAIENFLAKRSAERAVSEHLKREGILPPPDRAPVRRFANRRPALSHAERRRYHAERSRNGLHFLLLFSLAIGLGWWLIFSGI